MRRNDSLEKTLRLGKIEGRRRRGQRRMRWFDGITNSIDIVWASSGSWWWTGKPGMLQSVGSQGDGHNWVTKLNLKNPDLSCSLVSIPCQLCHCNTVFKHIISFSVLRESKKDFDIVQWTPFLSYTLKKIKVLKHFIQNFSTYEIFICYCFLRLFCISQSYTLKA